MNNEELTVKMTEIDGRSRRNEGRIRDLETNQDSLRRLTTAVEVMATEQKHQTAAIGEIREDVSKLDTKVEGIEQRPAKRWDGFVDKAVWAVAAAIIAFTLGRLGLT